MMKRPGVCPVQCTSPWSHAGRRVTEELHLTFSLIEINLHLDSHMVLVATVLENFYSSQQPMQQEVEFWEL